MAQLQFLNVHAGTGGYDVPEDLSGSSYLSSASKPPLLGNEEVSQNATYFQEPLAPKRQLPEQTHTDARAPPTETAASEAKPSREETDEERMEREEAQRIINLTRQIQRTFQTCSLNSPE